MTPMHDTLKIDKGNVKVVAHRGLSGIETENTCLAFVAAGNRSYYGIETDVHVTGDGKFVIIHDNVTSRVSEETLDVETANMSDIGKICLKDREDGASRNDIRVPELDDYVKICKRYGKVSVLEIKSVFTREKLEEAVAVIKKREYLNNVIFISFHIQNLLILREILPEDHKLQFLCGELSDDMIDLLVGKKIDVDIHYPTLLSHKEYMEKFKKGGLEVNCWTCDDPGDAAVLRDMGVDYITTNILE